MDISPHARDTAAGRSDGSPLVVGVSTDGRAASAVVWAAEEANRAGVPLRLVSARHDEPLDEIRRHHLAGLARRITLEPVEHVIHEGTPAAVIREAAGSGSVVVVGRRGMSWLRRRVVGGTSLTLAATSPVPVVVVPEAWMQPPLCALPIVLGLEPDDLTKEVGRDVDDAAAPALTYAFERAAARRVELHVVSAWQVPPVFLRNARAIAGCRARFDRQLADRLAPWIARYPQVDVEARSFPGAPVPALLEAERQAQLTVVGRFHGDDVPSMGLGATTGALVRRCRRPLAVIPPRS